MSELQRMKSAGCKTKICEHHGKYEAKQLKGFNDRVFYTSCPECDAEAQAKREAEEKELKRREYYDSLKAIGISQRFLDSSFENYEPVSEKAQRALKTIVAYRDQFDKMKESGTSLVLCGRPGTGKTHLASALAISLRNRPVPDKGCITYQGLYITYTTSFRMMARIKATYNRYEAKETETSVINNLINRDLLIIDEVGVQFGSEAEKVLFYQVINGRYDNVLPTVLISNLTAQELEKFVGERCFDRLKEGSGAVLSFDWDSYRR